MTKKIGLYELNKEELIQEILDEEDFSLESPDGEKKEGHVWTESGDSWLTIDEAIYCLVAWYPDIYGYYSDE